MAYDLDLTRYLNAAPPAAVTQFNGSTVYEFDVADGPVCMRGEPFRTSIRESKGSNDLLIFLQGGGACLRDFCLAVKVAPPGVPSGAQILNPKLDINPLKDWNVAYLPYCDGSLFIGDNVLDDNGDGTPDRFHKGLHNVSAALTIARREFPAPDRIALAGSSGGGFGTIMTVFLVRYIWPDTPIYVINDSGVGVAKDGNTTFVDELIEDFGAERFRPKDCPECLNDGHIIGLVPYFLARDPNTRVATYSSWYDGIISESFLKIGRGPFAEALEAKTGEVHDAFPEQYRRFIVDDYSHTGLLSDVTGIIGSDIRGVEIPPGMASALGSLKIGNMNVAIGDLTLAKWLDYFVNDNMDEWVDLTQERTPLPVDEGDGEGEGETP